MNNAPASLFALGQKVEVHEQLRWLPAKITGIRLTSQGLVYEVEGVDFTGSAPPSAVRPAGDFMPAPIIAICWTSDGVFYKVDGGKFPAASGGRPNIRRSGVVVPLR